MFSGDFQKNEILNGVKTRKISRYIRLDQKAFWLKAREYFSVVSVLFSFEVTHRPNIGLLVLFKGLSFKGAVKQGARVA